MILINLNNFRFYKNLHPLFEAGFQFIQTNKDKDLPSGRIPLLEDRLIAIVDDHQGKKRQDAPLEAHQKYIDLHYTISGYEEIGWRWTQECLQIDQPYDKEKDIVFFADTPSTWLPMHANTVAVFFPEDAHAPFVSDGPIRKFIIKVAVQ